MRNDIVPNPETLFGENADNLRSRLQQYTNGQITALSLQVSARIAVADDASKNHWEIVHQSIARERKRRNPAG